MLWECIGRHPHLPGSHNLLRSHFAKTCHGQKYVKFAIVAFNFRSLFLLLLLIYLFDYLFMLQLEGEWGVGNCLRLFYLSECTRKKLQNYVKKLKHWNNLDLNSKNKNYVGMCACPHQAFCSMWYLQNLQCTVALQ